MSPVIAAYGAAAVAFIILDGLWLSFVGPKMYKPVLGDLLLGSVRPAPAILFYIIYIGGIIALAVRPAVRTGALNEALVMGLILGFVAYGTFDLTNHAILKSWSWKITIADMLWGSFVTGMGAVAGLWAWKLAAR
jgi:uncharacterized membrane protein